MALTKAQAWRNEEGYGLIVDAPGVDLDKVKIETGNQRFMIYYLLDVLEGREQLPYFLVNLPLALDVDVEGITAKVDNGKLVVHAPLNDWNGGPRRQIDIDKG